MLSVIALSYGECKKSGSSSPPSSGGNNNGNGATNPAPTPSDVSQWLTTPDKASLLQKQNVSLVFGKTTDSTIPTITVDSTQLYQSIDGFGFTLTGGSAYVLYSMTASARASLLRELFSTDSNAISISYLRLSIGASDLNSAVFSYDDLPAGQTDTALANFSLSLDTSTLVPLLKEILAVNPNIKIIATPWSAPVWMKDNGSSKGGSLQTQYYGVYANYFVKYIRQMKANGISIDAITPQNEPLNPDNNPSLYMTAAEETDFIKNNLGPAFAAAGITTKIVVYDHNCDHPEYATTVFSDATAYNYANGSAFHLYAGDISALTTVHNAYPSKSVYFTEQYTASTGSFSGDLQWHIKNVIIGSMLNWSRNALEWNLATNESYGPYTSGGCSTCQGALTVNGSAVTRNVSYYIVAHAAKFIPAGSIRIGSNTTGTLTDAAFLTPAGNKVLLVENTGSVTVSFNIKYKGRWVATALAAGAVATYTW